MSDSSQEIFWDSDAAVWVQVFLCFALRLPEDFWHHVWTLASVRMSDSLREVFWDSDAALWVQIFL
jgi:hypothetical protein